MSAAGQRRLVLASRSERRRALVTAFAIAVEAITPTGPESDRRAGETPEDYVVRLSEAKALEVAAHETDAVVLGADTAVVVDDDVLGKPRDEAEATQMLSRLRGRTHRVVTGVVLAAGDGSTFESAVRSTDVTMRDYSDSEVAAYVATSEPYDKAGGYAVQDPLFRPAERVDGCYLNVVGLPLCEVASLFERVGADAALRRDWAPPVECSNCPLGSN